MAASGCAWVCRGVLAASLLCTSRASAQEPLFDRLNLDKLQLVSLGVSGGRILASQVEAAMLVGVTADYGEFARDWHIVFGVSYWESRYRDAVVQTFVDSLNKNLGGDSSGAVVVPSRISMYDVTFSGEARYTPQYSGEIKPYVGVGFAAHVINAEGKLINGTFIERSLDNIAAGLFLTSGISLKLFSHLGVEGGVRADLLSGFRSTQIRGGGTYYFGHVRGTQTAPAGDGRP
jgi:hypothetical protein